MIKQSSCGLRRFCWGVIPVLAFALGALNALAATGNEKVVTDHSTYVVGAAIKVAFTNGPANPTDWIGIYKEGEVPGRTGVTSTKYLYVGGGGSAGAGLANGEVTFTTGLAEAGNYVAFFLEEDGYRVLAQDAFTVIDPAAPLVQTDKPIYQRGEKITVTFARGPGNAKDWIGIYAAGVTPGPGSLVYRYVDNTTTGTTGKTEGTVTFDTGIIIPGKWVAYLLENDDYIPLAQDAFEVVMTGNGVVTITPDHQNYLPGQPITIAFDGGPGNPTDWIGAYRPEHRPGPNPSTDWRYVNDTQNATVGLSSGAITLDDGLTGPDRWVAYFLLNDAYTIAGNTEFNVLDAFAPLVQTSKRVYNLGESISVVFTNAPGNAKDWIGIYPKGVDPVNATATLWNYTDGTRTGTGGITEGELAFAAGLNTQDVWTAYLFENDTYTVLGQEDFKVEASGVLAARIVSISPDEGGAAGPTGDLRLVLENRDTTVDLNSISVKLDGADATVTKTQDGARTIVTTQFSSILAAGSPHTYVVSFRDSAGTTTTRTVNFTIGAYNSLTLAGQLFLETFESTPEGSLPAGWTASNQSGTVEVPFDLGHLGSIAYNNFLVVDSARLGGSFLTYGDGTVEAAPIAQILGGSKVPDVVNGALIRTYAQGKILLGISGYHGAGNEILEVVTRDFNLTDVSNVHLGFHSLMEQNQDSIAGIEVSNDGGATWHPVVYYLDPPDIVRVDNVIDVDQTFNTERADIARLPDGSGGTYGTFLKAPISESATHIQARVDNDPADGTRFEYIPVPAANGKAQVRFRIFYAGTDSWYFGLDNFGIYGNAVVCSACGQLSVTGNANSITIQYAGGILESTTAIGPNAVWTPVQGAANGTYTTPPTGSAQFFRVKQ